MSNARVTIDLDNVVAAGGVEAAIEKWCQESDLTASGVIGQEFSTSGPGPGWSRQHTVQDFASRAFSGGASYYIDSSDGRLASSPEWDDDEYDGEEIEWTDDSVVRIERPEVRDAIRHPQQVAEMAQAIIDYHGPESDRAEWAALVRAIRDAGEALADIDPCDLETE